jgi:3-oxoacyl-[acyl-carrier protein] reductase
LSQFFTSGILQHLNPGDWRTHRFGLPIERWENLRGKSFWITGAGTGYGRCIALALAAAEAQVFITGRRSEKLEETRTEAISLGIDPVRFVAIAADITNPLDMQCAAETISRHAPCLYGLVNNAALPAPQSSPWPLADLGVAEWNALLATNLTGQWLVSKAALPLMTKSECLRIVFMTSEAGWAFTPGFGPYNLSKAGVNNLGASLAVEYAARFPDKDVQINVLVPGEARTEMNQGSDESPFSIVCMTLALLSHPSGGPNGCFFHRDGRHLPFAYATPFLRSLFAIGEDVGISESRLKIEPAGWKQRLDFGRLLRLLRLRRS